MIIAGQLPQWAVPSEQAHYCHTSDIVMMIISIDDHDDGDDDDDGHMMITICDDDVTTFCKSFCEVT